MIGVKTYSDEQLTKACSESKSVREVMDRIGMHRRSSSSHTHISKRIKMLGIDTTHFVMKLTNNGGGKTKKRPEDILILYSHESLCPRVHLLRRALIEIGVNHVCECGQGSTWLGQPLTLQVDHRDGNRANCRVRKTL